MTETAAAEPTDLQFPSTANGATPATAPLQLCSRELFCNGNTVRIEHNGQYYWLRLTRTNKLILTK
jgi:hemin uptake protein HemP